MKKILVKVVPKKKKKHVKQKVLKKWGTAMMRMHEDTVTIKIVAVKNLKNKTQ